MPNENEMQPIGDPQRLEESKGLNIWHAVNAVAIASIGFVVFTAFLKPARCSGATRSARLKWEQRKLELQNSAAALDSNGASSTASSENENAPLEDK